jgi:hypothetical protein
VAYNDPSWLAERHGLGATVATTVAMLTIALKRVVAQAAGSPTP